LRWKQVFGATGVSPTPRKALKFLSMPLGTFFPVPLGAAECDIVKVMLRQFGFLFLTLAKYEVRYGKDIQMV
jgi:hypothetical protein